ncbi:ATP-grasp domain-containing protein [Glycomyces harbinensis]|uniref:ATP-grasp domain-containing protein n=1 Tax=Glycomyces harbinensis TaxID=58114 RepID=A0A1G6ZK22_9ACTN|nr:ATP-grasp domain-containing protein [Glycomyces harbinensis]SDE02851.1 ATP-grasp domain-containing protein [Glycomyces harbinensis]
MTTTADRPRAFILTGAFWVICRSPRYLTELARRDLSILVVTPEGFRDRAEAVRAQEDGPASLIHDVAYVSGSLDMEASFNSGVVAAVAAWRERYRIEGAYAVGETLVEPTGIIADALGLPFPGLRATRVCRSKYLQRWYLHRHSPASLIVPPSERDGLDPGALDYPAVLKPATRHSSSGVVSADEPADIARELAAYPDHETLLIEQKVTGPEYSVETLSQGGRRVFASVTAKTTNDTRSRAFVELSHTVGGADPANGALLDANADVLDRLGFEDGITHSEWRLDPTGTPRLMEIAARTPGDGLLPLYELATGRPLEDQIIRIALGEPAEYPRPRRVARQVYLEHPHGVLEDVRLDWPGVTASWIGETDLWPRTAPGAADDPPTLRAVFVHREKGATLGPLHSSDDRAVAFLIDAPDTDGLDEIEARVRSAIDIVVS